MMCMFRVGVITDPPLQESVTDPQTLLDALVEPVEETVAVERNVEVSAFVHRSKLITSLYLTFISLEVPVFSNFSHVAMSLFIHNRTRNILECQQCCYGHSQ